jgi:hypothetical protein
VNKEVSDNTWPDQLDQVSRAARDLEHEAVRRKRGGGDWADVNQLKARAYCMIRELRGYELRLRQLLLNQ